MMMSCCKINIIRSLAVAIVNILLIFSHHHLHFSGTRDNTCVSAQTDFIINILIIFDVVNVCRMLKEDLNKLFETNIKH